MSKEQTYNDLYQNMENGVYNGVVRTQEKHFAPSSEILVRLVKKACKENEVSFDDFMDYARKRKKAESNE